MIAAAHLRSLIVLLMLSTICTTVPHLVVGAANAQFEERVSTLKQGLDVTSWNSAESGLILAIAPDYILHNFPTRDDPDYVDPPEVLYFPEPGRGLRLDAVACYFDRRVVRFGSLAAVVPNETVVLNTHLRTADPFASLQYNEKVSLFEGGLSAAQWAILGSPNGIGVGDLAEDQQTLFRSILPDPVPVEKWHTADDVTDRYFARRRLTGEDRAQLRLRVNWTSSISLIDGAGKTVGYQVSESDLEPVAVSLEEYDHNPPLADSLYGAQIRMHVSNWPKTGQLDFALPALDAAISTQSANTVGDLVRLVREQSKLDIYVDGRLAPFSVYISNRDRVVRSGDVLEALCLALSGTIRKVGPDATGDVAYVLTNSIESLGARRAVIGAWEENARRQLNSVLWKSIDARDAQRPGQYLSLQSDDPMAVSPEIMHQIEDDWSRPGKNGTLGEITIPVSELSPLQRNAVAMKIEKYKQNLATNPSPGRGGVSSSNVRINLMVAHSWIIPGYGTARVGGMEMGYSWIPPTQAPKPRSWLRPAPDPALVVLKDATVAIAPQGPGETASVMDILKRKGVRRMWVAVSDDAKGRGLLEEAVAAGQAHGISVSPLVRLMSAEGGTVRADDSGKATGSAALDLDIFGVSGATAPLHSPTDASDMGGDLERYVDFPVTDDVLDPSSAQTTAILERRLNDFAAVKGIAGIALSVTAVLGRSASAEFVRASPRFADLGTDFGYTPRNRLRFLREQGYDPIDLLPARSAWWAEYVRTLTALPYIDSTLSLLGSYQNRVAWKTSAAWAALCQAEQTTLLENVQVAFRKAHPAVPVYVPDGRSSLWAFARSYTSWPTHDDAPSALETSAGGSQNPTAQPTANEYKEIADLPCFVCTPALISCIEHGSFLVPVKTAGASLSWLFQPFPGRGDPKPVPDGAILDFTAMPITDTILLLRDGLADQAP